MRTVEPWYSVRCLFEHPDFSKRDGVTCYEERVVVLRARSFKEAIRKGESEARRYCGRGRGPRYLNFIEVFHLFDTSLKDGTEVCSVMRSKAMPKGRFIKTYYDDGSFRRGLEPERRPKSAVRRKRANSA